MSRFWNFKNAAENQGELTIYGPISSESWWEDDVTPKKFKKDLDDLGNIDELDVYINSPGGDVFAGQTIYSILKRHKAKKMVHVDGLAASAASIIAMAGNVVHMPSNAMLMIHNPYTLGVGNANEFRRLADDLDKIRESIIAVYEGKTALLRDEIIKMMDDETWLTAKEALDYGFADMIDEEKQIAASVKDGNLFFNGVKIDLSKYKNKPKIMVLEGKKPEEQQANLLSTYQKMLNVRKNKYKEGM